ncbi:MAG TPA: hypothetical protein VJC39_03515 [Candidatus Nanoarchaeia archaeon]|nr:hypothetical protein [Candidatus Nanoarchaeia archaeon]
MFISPRDKSKLYQLSAEASKLLVDIIGEDETSFSTLTITDQQFKNLLPEMYSIAPLLADSYVAAYNSIQHTRHERSDDPEKYKSKIIRPNDPF